jgi:drug/metabolite transporter (DMT)-like permease
MLIEVSLIFAFLATICWGFGDFLIQKSVRKIGNLQSLALIGIVGAIALFPFILHDIKNIFNLYNIGLLLLLGIITFVAAIFDFEALKRGKISVIDVLIELELPVTIILGFVFFKEVLSLQQIGIISLIFIGILLMAFKHLNFKKHVKSFEKGAFLAILAALGMGLINFLTAASSRQISPLMAVWFPWIVFTIICIFFIWSREGIRNFSNNISKFKWLVLAMGIFDTLAWLSYAYATNKGEIAIITAITESYPALAMFLGLWINKERINLHQYIGAGLAIVSSIFLSFIS